MRNLILIITFLAAYFLHSTFAIAQVYLEKQDTPIINLLVNAGYENGKGGRTISVSSTVTLATGANALQGATSLRFDASAASQTVTSALVTVPPALVGGKCQGEVTYLTVEDTNKYIYQVLNASGTVIASKTLDPAIVMGIPVEQYQVARVRFDCPTKMRDRVISTGAAVKVDLDSGHLGSVKNLEASDIFDLFGYVPVQSVTVNSPLVVSGTGTNPVISMSQSGAVSGASYTKVYTDGYGRVTSGTSLVENDIPPLSASKIASGTLPVARGGTGVSSVTNGDTLYASGGTWVKRSIGTEGQVYKVVNGTPDWGVGGSSDSENVIVGGDAESTNPFVVLFSSSASRPAVSATTATASMTVTVSSTSPLKGLNSFVLTKSATNALGVEAIIPFTVQPDGQAKAQTITFDYRVVSGTFQTGSSTQDSDLIVYIQDRSNGQFIEPSTIKFTGLASNTAERFQAAFQTSSSGTLYNLILHQATSATTSYQLKLDNFSVAKNKAVYGTPVTDWQIIPGGIAITDAAGANVKSANPVTNTASWRRVGSNIELKIAYYHSATAGVAGATGAYRFVLPFGLTIDSRPEVSGGGSNSPSGLGMVAGDIGGGYWSTFKPYGSPTSNYFELQVTEEQNTIRTVLGNGSGGGFNSIFSFNQNNVGFSGVVTFPIQGWGATSQTSDQAETRIVNLVAATPNATQALTSNVTNVNFTAIKDSHGAWNGSQYIVPVAGDYQISVCLYAVSSVANYVLYVNGSYWGYIGSNPANIAASHMITYPNAKAGDVISIRAGTNFTVNADVKQTMSITRISGPSAIAANELVAARYTGTTGTTVGTTATAVVFNTKDYDTHGIYNSTTGVTTIPIAGKYRIGAEFLFLLSSTVGSGVHCSIYKNGSQFVRLTSQNAWAASTSVQVAVQGWTTLNLVAGDLIEIRAFRDTNTAANAIDTNTLLNYFTIERQGF